MSDRTFIQKTINWFNKSSEAIKKSGGDAPFVIEKFSPDLLEILVKNDLFLTYAPVSPSATNREHGNGNENASSNKSYYWPPELD